MDSKERLEICEDCPKLTKRKFCKMCGCFMPAKARVPFLHCPIKKW